MQAESRLNLKPLLFQTSGSDVSKKVENIKYISIVSHTTYVVYVNFIQKWRDLQFKVDSERQIFEKLFMTVLFPLRAFARNLLKGNVGTYSLKSTPNDRFLKNFS